MIAACIGPWYGSGNGRAASVTAQTITVSATTGAADLYPGFTLGDLHFVATNPNPYAVTFTAFTEAGITSSNQATCPAANVTVDDSAAISVVVPAKAVNQALSIANVVTMSSSAPDGCQNKTFDITITLTGSQS
jgi:hypothetical protein